LSALRPRLIAVWGVCFALLAAILLVERNERAASEAPSGPDARAFLPVPLADLGALEIGRAGAMHRFERAVDGAWYYHGPHDSAEPAHEHRADPAQAERIAFALAGLGRARIERKLALEADGAQYGLSAPSMVIVVYRVNEPRPFAQYVVGDLAPDSLSRYVRQNGASEVVTLPDYQIQNLVQLIESMKKESR